jgi:hypothetical protein
MDPKSIELMQVTLNRNFTQPVCTHLFGTEHGDRLWSKHYMCSSKSDIVLFNEKFDSFANGKYTFLHPKFDEWLIDQISIAFAPMGYRIVKQIEEDITICEEALDRAD